jgi:hypothetical protein
VGVEEAGQVVEVVAECMGRGGQQIAVSGGSLWRSADQGDSTLGQSLLPNSLDPDLPLHCTTKSANSLGVKARPL